MNVNSIFVPGGQQVKNPNYTPNNGQPEYIMSTMVNADNGLADLYRDRVVDNNLGVIGDSKDLDKYTKYGLTPNKFDNLDSQLADAQSNWAKAFNALGQTVVSEIGLGTLIGFSDLVDFIASKIFGVAEDDYQNPASELLKQWQDTFNNEIAPIYTKGKDISNGGLTDAGWWWSNVPQIASSLTLLIPSRGAGWLASKAGKGLRALGRTAEESTRLGRNIGRLSTKAQRWVNGANRVDRGLELTEMQRFINNPLVQARTREGLKIGADALLMRTMENYQEARDVHQQTMEAANSKFGNMSDEEFNAWVNANPSMKADMEEKGVDTSSKIDVSRYIAKKAADRDFSMNFGNVIFDIIQLYGLKDIGRGIRRARGARVQAENRNSILTAIESAGKEVPAEGVASKLTKGAKFKAATTDLLRGSGKEFLEESTEGIEEAINFISQQEGLSYGKTLLEGKDDGGGFIQGWRNAAGNIKDYMKDPELWESAFWGWMGGMVFGAGGSAMNRAQMYFYNKANQERVYKDPITGEERKIKDDETKDWLDLWSMPEEKAAITAIRKRGDRLNMSAHNLKDIGDNLDIFGPTDANGKLQEFRGDKELEQAMAREEAINQYRAELAMDAMQSGTFSSLLDYFRAEPVKKAMVQAGVASEENVDAFVDQTVNYLQHVQDIYDGQASEVMSQLTTINSKLKFGEKAPIEVAQSIAKNNTRLKLQAESITDRINAAAALAAKQEHDINDDDSRTAEDIQRDKDKIHYAMLTDMLGRVTADIKYLNDNKTKENSVETEFEIFNLEKQRDAILKQLRQEDTTSDKARVLGATEIAKRYVKTYETDEVTKRNKATYSLYKQADDAIVKVYEETGWALEDDEKNSVLHMAKVNQNQIDEILKKDGLRGLSPRLYDTYLRIANLEIQKTFVNSQIARTSKDVENELDKWVTRNNTARRKAIDMASDTMVNLYEKYKGTDGWGKQDMRRIITARYLENKEEARSLAEEVMSSDDAAKLMDALDIFKFGTGSNERLHAYLNGIFAENEETSARENTSLEVSSSTSENNADGSQTLSTDETSPMGVESGIENAGQQIKHQTETLSTLQTEIQTPAARANGRPITNARLILNSQGQLVQAKTANSNKRDAVFYANDNGTYELDIQGLPKNDQAKYIFSGMFDGDDLNTSDDNAPITIKNNPIFIKKDSKFELYKKGYVQVGEDNVRTPVEENGSNDQHAQTEDNQTTKFKVGDILESPKGPIEITGIEEGFYEYKQVDGPAEDLIEIAEVDGDGLNWYIKEPDNPSDTIETAPVTISSTGVPEVEITPDESIEEVKTNETPEVSEEAPKLTEKPKTITPYDVFNGIVATARKYAPDLSVAIDFEELRKQVKDELLSKAALVDLTEDELATEIDKYIDQLKEIKEEFDNMDSSLDKQALNLSMASRGSEVFATDTTAAERAFVAAMNAFMDEYEKTLILKRVDGRKVIKLRDVLKICNDIYADKNHPVVLGMYETLKAYLLSPTGRSEYIVIDEDDVRRDNVVRKASLSDKELERESDKETLGLSISTTRSINLMENTSITDDATRLKFRELFNGLKVGDELYMENGSTALEFSILYKDAKGNTQRMSVGDVPKAAVVGDRYVLYESGWRNDVTKDKSGRIISDTKDAIIRIFTAEGSEFDKLRAIILKASRISEQPTVMKTKMGDHVIDEFGKLVEEFKANHIIDMMAGEAIQEYKDGSNSYGQTLFIEKSSGEPNYRNMLTYLVKLYRYVNTASNGKTVEANKFIVQASVEKWFEKLYETYDTINKVTESGTVTVSYVNEGQVNQIVTTKSDNFDESYAKYNYASKGLAPSTNAKLGSISAPGVITTSGAENQEFNDARGLDSTFVVLFSRNTRPAFIKAAGIMLNDSQGTSGNEFVKKLLLSCTYKLNNVLDNYISTPTGGAEDVMECLKSIFKFNSVAGYIPIIRGKHGNFKIEYNRPGSFRLSPAMSAVTISYKDNGEFKTFRIFLSGKQAKTLGYQTYTNNIADGPARWFNRKENSNIGNQIAVNLMHWVKPFGQLDIDINGINSDNNTTTKYNGFFTRTSDGKLRINIDGYTPFSGEFDSYNDFVIKNDLIKVNTEIGENGTNFTKSGSNMRANQKLFVNLQVTKRSNTSPTSTTNEDSTKIRDSRTPDANGHPVQSDSDAELYAKLVDRIGTDGNTNGSALFEMVTEPDRVAEWKALTGAEDILDDLFGTRVLYDPYLEKLDSSNRRYATDGGVNAYTRGGKQIAYYRRFKPNGERVTARMPVRVNTIIGPTLLNELSSTKRNIRDRGLRHLIHERLHALMQRNVIDRERLIKNATPILEELKVHLRKDIKELPKSNNRRRVAEGIIDTLRGEKGDRLIEEFIVNALTNGDFYAYMNTIEVEDFETKQKESLFSRIAKVIAEFFGWKINDNSLYAKTLNMLREDISSDNSTPVEDIEGNNGLSDNVDTDNLVEPQEPTDNSSEGEEDENEESDEYSLTDSLNDEYAGLFDSESSDDDLANPSSGEEVASDGFVKISSIEAYTESLPIDVQESFKDIKDNGLITYKCK